jgi:hypothetical protein
MIIPTALEYGFTENKGYTLAAFANYFLCEGQQQAQVLGYSPLPINLAQAGLNQVLKIPGGDNSKVNIKSCNNPTFSADGSNKLANTAAQPQACDKAGPTQCLTGTGGAKAATIPSKGGSKNGASVAGGATSTDDSGGAGAGTGGAADSPTSHRLAVTGDSRVATVAGVPTTISSVTPVAWYSTIGVLAVAAIVFAAVFIPAGRARRRKRGRSPPAGKVPRQVLPTVHLPSWRRTRAPRPTAQGDQ